MTIIKIYNPKTGKFQYRKLARSYEEKGWVHGYIYVNDKKIMVEQLSMGNIWRRVDVA